jgi:pyruvate kinase
MPFRQVEPLGKVRTKIVATIGPASEDRVTLRRMVAAGMNMARLSLAHGPVEETLRRIEAVRRAAAEEQETVGILADLPGPKVRAALFPPDGVYLNEGDEAELVPGTDGEGSDWRRIALDHPDLLDQLRPGDRVALGDGGIELAVKAVRDDRVVTRVVTGGQLRGRPGVTLPAGRFRAETPTPEDLRLLGTVCQAGVDAVAISFVRAAGDVERVRAAAGSVPVAAGFGVSSAEQVRSLASVADGVVVGSALVAELGDGVDGPGRLGERVRELTAGLPHA